MRNHKPCYTATPIVKKRDANFTIVHAVPRAAPTNSYLTSTEEIRRKQLQKQQEAELEEEYRRNIEENKRLAQEGEELYRQKKLEEAARAAAKAEYERRLNGPFSTAMELRRQYDDSVQVCYINFLGQSGMIERKSVIAARNEARNKARNEARNEAPEKQVASCKQHDELSDVIWPALAKLTSEKKKVLLTLDKLILEKEKTKFPMVYDRSIRNYHDLLLELDAEIQVYGKRQKQLVM